jgi:hypothetical protein
MNRSEWPDVRALVHSLVGVRTGLEQGRNRRIDVEETVMSEERDNFRKQVEALVDDVRGWVESHEWVTRPYPKKIRDSDRQVFEVPALILQKSPTRVLLDPVAYDVPGADCLVDLYLMPTYDDLASLSFESGAWVIRYPFPSDPMQTHSVNGTETLPLSEGTINQVLDSIAAHAVPSF